MPKPREVRAERLCHFVFLLVDTAFNMFLEMNISYVFLHAVLMPPSRMKAQCRQELKIHLTLLIGTKRLQSLSSLQAVNKNLNSRMNGCQDPGKKKSHRKGLRPRGGCWMVKGTPEGETSGKFLLKKEIQSQMLTFSQGLA